MAGENVMDGREIIFEIPKWLRNTMCLRNGKVGTPLCLSP